MVSFTQITAVAVVALAANVQAAKIIPSIVNTVTSVLGKRDSVVMRGESSLYERGIYSPPNSPSAFLPLDIMLTSSSRYLFYDSRIRIHRLRRPAAHQAPRSRRQSRQVCHSIWGTEGLYG
jgi:hypothetical protein